MSESFTHGQKGQKTVYTSCMCNCGSNSQCVFKAHVKNGIVVAVEPDDRYNKNIGREDEVLPEQDLIRTRLQRRPCTMGLVFYKYIYHQDRILYPLKRLESSRRGEGKFVRISWDEALTSIANKMKEIKEKYGPYSIIIPFPYTPSSEGWVRIFSFWGAGVDSWGWSSYDSTRLNAHIMAGVSGWDYPHYGSSSAADMLANSKLIVLWGIDPTLGSSGPGYQFAWFIKLARERGKPVIIFDPRYTTGAEVLADQWIPIRPGTDMAMFLAMANVLFKENLWDRDFVAKYVEPEGFNKWKNYVMGADDGVQKTPEWAESRCAVPAETIRELTRLIVASKPAWLWCNWGVSRKSHGEETAKGFAALQAILGYWGLAGAGPPMHLGPQRNIPVQTAWGSESGSYSVPKMYRAHYWAQAVLLLEKVRNGELSEKEYMRIVGWKADPSLLKDFNPKMALLNAGYSPHASDFVVTATDSTSDQVTALRKMEFIVGMHSMMTSTLKYADIILPVADPAWEERNFNRTNGSYGGFQSINGCPGVVEPLGEAKPWVWVYSKLAEKLGIDPKVIFSYYTSDENWNEDWERYLVDSYQGIVDYYKERNIEVASWKEFSEGRFINCDELDDKPFVGWEDQMKHGKPFKTESGKIEFYSRYVANETNKGKGEHLDTFDRVYELLPSDWSDYAPLPVYNPPVKGMDDPLIRKHPLMLLSPHCRYRVHYLFYNHTWLRNHIYRHRVWISTTDANVRNIRDNDKVLVYNERGRIIMPAYVSSRIMPGLVVIHHGGWYMPDKSGVDFGGSPSTLLGGDFKSNTTPAKTTTLVQVEKYE